MAPVDGQQVRRRRPTGLLLGGILLAIALGGVASRLADTATSVADELEGRIGSGETPRWFAFAYSRGGTRVQDCFTANLRFLGEVDAAAERFVLRLNNGGATVAANDGRTARLHRSLFGNPPFRQEWLAVRLPVDDATREALRPALGADFAADALAARPPVTGQETVWAAIDVADRVERLAAIEIEGERADGYRIIVDPARFAAVTDRTEDQPSSTSPSAPAPSFDVWISDSENVVRVRIRPLREDGTPGPAENSWAVDYRRLASAPEEPPAASTASAEAIDLSGLAPALRPCQLPQ